MEEHEDGALERLRGGLDVELGALIPSPAPFESVLAQGRAIRRHRRRVWGGAVSAVALCAVAAGLLVPGTLRGGRSGPPPTTPASRDWISVSPSAYDEAHGLMGSGAVLGVAWSITSRADPLNAYFNGKPMIALEVHMTVDGKTTTANANMVPPTKNPLEDFLWLDVGQDTAAASMAVGFGVVAPGVGSIVAHYANGESVSYPAVEHGGERYVAVLAVATTTIDRLTVYGTDGAETGYEEPFTLANDGAPGTASGNWYAPNQTPALAPATVTLTGTMVDAPGSAWTLGVQAGGFGICMYPTAGEPFGDVACIPPGSQTSTKPLEVRELGDKDPATLVVGPLDPAVTRVVATLKGGQTVDMPIKTIDGLVMGADVFAPGKVVTGVTAYKANGGVFAHTSLD